MSQDPSTEGIGSTQDLLRAVRGHLDAALAHLDIDDEVDRLVNPRHTDHDRHVYLPAKVAAEIAAARHEIQLVIDELSGAEERS